MEINGPADIDPLRSLVAQSCRVLARRGLVEGILGHVSARLPGQDAMLIRARGPAERGLLATVPADIRLMTMDGALSAADQDAGWRVPNEYPIHAAVYQARPGAGAVVHAHPSAALLCGLAGLTPRPVIGAYNIPALHLARTGIPVYPRAVLISRPELAAEMLAAMAGADVCILRGHGVTVTGPTVQEATLRALNLEMLCQLTVDLARLSASAPEIPDADMAELPDLGGQFNVEMTWNALGAD
jgi:ribulose-5-phosphate 4-epimerase/fuculose-1-phosphate aldolase